MCIHLSQLKNCTFKVPFIVYKLFVTTTDLKFWLESIKSVWQSH